MSASAPAAKPRPAWSLAAPWTAPPHYTEGTPASQDLARQRALGIRGPQGPPVREGGLVESPPVPPPPVPKDLPAPATLPCPGALAAASCPSVQPDKPRRFFFVDKKHRA